MDDVISPERLSALIGRIYDCAIDPSRWAATIDAIRIELGFAIASLDLMVMPEGKSLLNVMANIPEPYDARMLDYAPQVTDMWGGADIFFGLPLDEPAVLTRVVPDLDQLWRHPMYTEWAEPQGVNDILALWLARDRGAIGVIALGRSEAAGRIGERELRLARMLIPHLQRAATINRLLDLAALKQATFESLFDSLAVPVFLTDADLTIVHTNEAGRRTLAAGDPVCARGGKLHALEPAAARALAVGARASQETISIGRKGMGIPVHRRDGSVGALYVLPVAFAATSRLSRPSSDRATVAVFLAQAATASIAPPNLIAALFGLTAAEAKVFEQITGGATMAGAAEALQIRESTVKTHLLRIYDKTGLRRQPDLVRMAVTLAAPATIN